MGWETGSEEGPYMLNKLINLKKKKGSRAVPVWGGAEKVLHTQGTVPSLAWLHPDINITTEKAVLAANVRKMKLLAVNHLGGWEKCINDNESGQFETIWVQFKISMTNNWMGVFTRAGGWTRHGPLSPRRGPVSRGLNKWAKLMSRRTCPRFSQWKLVTDGLPRTQA